MLCGFECRIYQYLSEFRKVSMQKAELTNLLLKKGINPKTAGNARMCAQHCGNWCPGAKACTKHRMTRMTNFIIIIVIVFNRKFHKKSHVFPKNIRSTRSTVSNRIYRIRHEISTRLGCALISCAYIISYWVSVDSCNPFTYTIKPLIYVLPNPKTKIFIVSSCIRPCRIHWSHVLSREWRLSLSAMLQLRLSDQQFHCLLRCDLY